MKIKLVALALVMTLVTMFIAPAASQAASTATAAGAVVPVNFTSAAGSFVGQFNITSFAVQNGKIVGIGTLTGTVKDAAGTVLGTVNQALTLPLLTATGTCEILHLELGPLDLTLLGLVVHLDKVVLDITAQSGSGNLLGNLLCAVAKLLDSNAAPNAIVNMLNRILGLLG